MRTVFIVTAAVLGAIGAGIAAMAGLGATARQPTSASLVGGTRTACVGGPARLVASATDVHPGEVIGLEVEGVGSSFLEGDDLTVFEESTSTGWSPIDELSSAGPGSDAYGIVASDRQGWWAGVGTTGPVKVRIPDVAAGSYRLVRFEEPRGPSAAVGNFPRHGADLCATVAVRSTPPARTATDDVGISVTPASELRSGQRVRVSVHGFGPGATVRLSECAFAELVTAAGCESARAGRSRLQLGPTGSGGTGFTVTDRASTRSGAGPTVVCATNCVLVATLGPGYAYVAAPLSFAVRGAVTGTLVVAGGPAPGLVVGVPGRVTFSPITRRRAGAPAVSTTVATAGDGAFAAVLAPGRYQVLGTSPEVTVNGRPMRCDDPGGVVVPAGATVTLTVVCPIP